MAVESLRTHLIEELNDLLDAEDQLTKALPKMAEAASTTTLRKAFESHLKETRNHVIRLNQALRQLGEKPASNTCEAMKGLLSEGDEMMNNSPEGAVRDAVMITAAQKVEHYEIATYGTVRTYARVIGETPVARLLAQTLKEEKNADAKLTMIAERSVNEDAAQAWREQEEQKGVVERSTEWVSETIGAASRQIAGGARKAAASMGIAADRSRKSPHRRRSAKRTGGRGRKRR
jgi:ferritin-like metal-binding protein YciE